MQLALPAFVGRLIATVVAGEDDEEERLRSATTWLFAMIVVVLSPVWIVTYLAVGRPLSASIPAAYDMITLASFAWVAWRRRFRAFPGLQLSLYAALPVLLQVSLGGFEHGSAIALWSFGAPIVALIVYGIRPAVAWFAVFAVSITILGLLDGALRSAVSAPPVEVQVVFFVLDVVAPGSAVMFVLVHFVRERDAANARTEALLLQILPATIVARLKHGESNIADGHDQATVLFADIVEFTSFADTTPPDRLVELLGRAFNELDELASQHGLEKIKTLGDGYLAVAGVTSPRRDHAAAATRMALDVQPVVAAALGEDWPELRFRVGLASGALVAGVIGRERIGFDIWGDIVNTASRMASGAPPGGVQVTEATAALIGEQFRLERRDQVEVKGKGPMTTFLVLGPRAPTGEQRPA